MRRGVAQFLCGLLQQGFSLIILHKCYRRKMIGAVFDVGRVSWFQRGLLHGSFSSIVVHKNYKRRGFVQSWERVSLFQCGFLHQDWFLTVLHRYYKRRKIEGKKGSGEERLSEPSASSTTIFDYF